MFHNEGGWKADVNHTDTNQLMRWRRKIEKDDHYVTQLMKISNVGWTNMFDMIWCLIPILQTMEGCIKQNNGIDIYVEYFEDEDEATQCDAPQAKTIGN